ncbi:MAG: hypothetical protein AAB930_03685 [Patescibacteria group bacterium]
MQYRLIAVVLSFALIAAAMPGIAGAETKAPQPASCHTQGFVGSISEQTYEIPSSSSPFLGGENEKKTVNTSVFSVWIYEWEKSNWKLSVWVYTQNERLADRLSQAGIAGLHVTVTGGFCGPQYHSNPTGVQL